MSRSFGDVPYRAAGLIAEPETSAWRAVTPGDQFLILASDGLFEVLSEDEVCQVAAATASGDAFSRMTHVLPAWSSPWQSCRPHNALSDTLCCMRMQVRSMR